MSTISFLDNQVCAVCQRGSIDGLVHPKCRTRNGVEGIISAVAYKGIVKKLVYQFKYEPYLSDLKGVLGRLTYEGLIQQEAFARFVNEDNTFLASVPLHIKKERNRGYNQADLLACELEKRLGTHYLKDILVRNRNTKPQFKLSKGERAKNIADAFMVGSEFKNRLKNKNIILVDDITTTGATIRECGKILKRSGVKKVLGVTLAHEG